VTKNTNSIPGKKAVTSQNFWKKEKGSCNHASTPLSRERPANLPREVQNRHQLSRNLGRKGEGGVDGNAKRRIKKERTGLRRVEKGVSENPNPSP